MTPTRVISASLLKRVSSPKTSPEISNKKGELGGDLAGDLTGELVAKNLCYSSRKMLM
jgi:hypothetical protein